jgi:hypothetical protein
LLCERYIINKSSNVNPIPLKYHQPLQDKGKINAGKIGEGRKPGLQPATRAKFVCREGVCWRRS